MLVLPLPVQAPSAPLFEWVGYSFVEVLEHLFFVHLVFFFLCISCVKAVQIVQRIIKTLHNLFFILTLFC